MDTNEFYLKIKIAYNDNNFLNIYNLFNEKLKETNIKSINYKIIRMYLYTLEMLNKEDEEIEILKHIYIQNNYFLEKLVDIYINKNDYNGIINLKCAKSDNLFLAAITCYKKGLYDKALYWFNEYTNKNNTKKETLILVKEYINRIEKHSETNCFLSLDFNIFLEKGYTLSAGDVVYVYDNKGLLEKDDKKRVKRPILIWKIEKDKIYGIPLTTRIKAEKTKILKSKYINLKKDSALRPDFLVFDKNKIKNVVERIEKEDLKKILYDLYISVICNSKNYLESALDFILDFMKNMNIEKYNIILYRDNNIKMHKKYFVLDINEKNYELIEVDKQKGKYVITNPIPITKNKKSPILSKIIIDKENIEEIINNIDERYKIKNKDGIIIELDNKKYVILKELQNDYICAFLPYSKTFAPFERISKDKNITFKEVMDEDELTKLERMFRDYAGKNNVLIEGYTPTTKYISKSIKKQRKI